MRPSKFEILAYEDTLLGPLCLRRRELLAEPGTMVTEVTLNHEFLMSSYNTDSEREISNRSVEIHGGEQLKTLVGGLGLGYTARELVNDANVASVNVIEFLPPVIDWLRDGLIPLSAELNAAVNLQVTLGDVYKHLWDAPLPCGDGVPDRYDLIVIDVDHSPGDQLAAEEHSFYSHAGLQRAKQHLSAQGVLAVWSYSESNSFATALRETFDQVQVEPVCTMNSLVGHEQTDWLFFATDGAM